MTESRPVVLVDATTLDGLPSGAATRLAALGAALAARGRVRALHLVRPGLEPLPGLDCLPFERSDTPWRRAWSGRRLAALARQQGAGLVQAGALPLPRLAGIPLLLTVHDLRWLDAREPQSFARRTWAARRLGPNLRRAEHFVAVSQSTAQALLARGLATREQVTVVPNAGTPGLQRVTDVERLAKFRRAMGLTGRYVLALGPLGAHKRSGFLLEVLAALRARPASADLGLVWAGRAEPDTALVFARRAQSLGLERVVRVAGVLPSDTLAEAYSAAEALLVAGTSEGFSLPIVDAQRLGVPVVAADAGALREVGGEGAWLAPSDDLTAFVDALSAALVLGPEREARLQRAAQLAQRWSWERSAETLEALWLALLSRTASRRG